MRKFFRRPVREICEKKRHSCRLAVHNWCVIMWLGVSTCSSESARAARFLYSANNSGTRCTCANTSKMHRIDMEPAHCLWRRDNKHCKVGNLASYFLQFQHPDNMLEIQTESSGDPSIEKLTRKKQKAVEKNTRVHLVKELYARLGGYLVCVLTVRMSSRTYTVPGLYLKRR